MNPRRIARTVLREDDLPCAGASNRSSDKEIRNKMNESAVNGDVSLN